MVELLWSTLASLAGTLRELLLVTDLGHRLHWFYLCTFLGLSALLYLIRRPAGTSLFRYLLPRSVYSHRSFRTDLGVYLVNGLLGGFVNLATLIASSAVIADLTTALIVWLSGTPEPGLEASGAVTLLFTVAFVLLSDLGLFLAHYLHHKVPFLWNFHKVHHSAEVLTPVTGFRFHPVEVVLNGLTVACTLGPLIGVYQFLFDRLLFLDSPLMFNLVLFAWLVTANFRHSHVPLSYPRAVSRWLVSPAMHNLHHSADAAHFDKNLGLVFAVWDRMAGTLLVPEGDETLSYGIGGGEERRFRSLRACLTLPFGQNVELARRRWRRRREKARPEDERAGDALR